MEISSEGIHAGVKKLHKDLGTSKFNLAGFFSLHDAASNANGANGKPFFGYGTWHAYSASLYSGLYKRPQGLHPLEHMNGGELLEYVERLAVSLPSKEKPRGMLVEPTATDRLVLETVNANLMEIGRHGVKETVEATGLSLRVVKSSIQRLKTRGLLKKSPPNAPKKQAIRPREKADELYLRNLTLATITSRRLAGLHGMSFQLLMPIAKLVLKRCAELYDESSKASFSTYAIKSMRLRINSEVRKIKANREVSLSEPIHGTDLKREETLATPSQSPANDELRAVADRLAKFTVRRGGRAPLLNKKAALALLLKAYGLSYAQVGFLLGDTSKQNAFLLVNSARNRLKPKRIKE